MGKIILTGHLQMPAAQAPVILAALEAHTAATRTEPGCLMFNP